MVRLWSNFTNYWAKTSTSSTTASPMPPRQSTSFPPSVSSPPPTTLPSRNTSYQSRPSNHNLTPLSTTSTLGSISRRQEPTAPDVHKPMSTGSHVPRSSYPQNLFPAPPRVQPQSTVVPLQQSKPPFQPTFSAPNYNIYTSPTNIATTGSTFTPIMHPSVPIIPQQSGMGSFTQPVQPQMGGLLTPSKPAQSSIGKSKLFSKDDWGDFDPLS